MVSFLTSSDMWPCVVLAATGMRKQLFKPAREAAEEAEEAEGEGAEKKKKEEVKGGGALVIVKDQGSAWQRLADKLRDAPIIQVRFSFPQTA